MPDEHLSEPVISQTASLFSALAHPGRLRILLALTQRAPRSATELAELSGLEQTAASHQLRLLRKVRLISAQRAGRQVLYSLADSHVSHIILDAIAHVQEEQ